MNIQAEALKLKVLTEHLDRVRTQENVDRLQHELKSLGNVNLQFIQDFLLTRLLILLESGNTAAKSVNEFKTALIQCANIVISRSKIVNELPYRTILSIVTKQIYDRAKNAYEIQHSEELKSAVFDCLEVSSRNLDFDVVESFMVKENQLLIGQCLFVCKEAIVRETYMRVRKKAVDALMALSHCHDQADTSDIVLREQISKVLFVVLPKISTSLIKVCGEDTLRGPHLIQAALKCLGRFLALIFHDYSKKRAQKITNADFLQLIDKSTPHAKDETSSGAQQKVTEMEKTDEWLQTSASNLSKILGTLKVLRNSAYREIRHELAVMSYTMLFNCLPNIEPLMRFMLENLIVLSADCDKEIQAYSQEKLALMAELIPRIDREISELFSHHLSVMPRTLMTGLDAERIAGMSLLSSYIRIFATDEKQWNAVLSNPTTLEMLLNILVCCCELEPPSEFINFETTVTNDLDDQYYQFKMPWKKFKRLPDESSMRMFYGVCRNLASAEGIASMCVNYIVDNINSIEHMICLMEILTCDENTSITSKEIENIFEEFLDDAYWNLPIKCSQVLEQTVKGKKKNEQWFKASTPGLYESAVEVRMYDDEHGDNQTSVSIKTLNYNILCTCIITELTGKVALKLRGGFQRFLLPCLHRILEKAGSSNFLIKSAGIYALSCVRNAMGFTDLSQLIDESSSFLLFNIHRLLKNSGENESLLDMLSIIFKYSKTSLNDYVDDIVEMATNQITSMKHAGNSRYHLKLFELYISFLSTEIVVEDVSSHENDAVLNWSDFLQNCMSELNYHEQEEEEADVPKTNSEEDELRSHEPTEQVNEEEKEKLPLHVELMLRILNTSLPFFASGNQDETILTHEIFRKALPILHLHEKEFLPMVHKMWYPFTKQFQGKDLVILQHSFELLTVIGCYAKDFIYKKSMDKIIPTVNEFLKSSHSRTNSSENFSYTQEFKLQKEILGNYGRLAVSLEVDDRELDEIISVLILYNRRHLNDQLKESSKNSLEFIARSDPMLIDFKLHFE